MLTSIDTALAFCYTTRVKPVRDLPFWAFFIFTGYEMKSPHQCAPLISYYPRLLGDDGHSHPGRYPLVRERWNMNNNSYINLDALLTIACVASIVLFVLGAWL